MRITSYAVVCVLGLLLQGFSASAVGDYKDTSLTVDERVENLISQMTLAEKIAQLGHKSAEISRLGVKSYNYWNEALHGVARSGTATSFPQAIALSATWNPALIYEVAMAISDEARIMNNTSGKGLTYWSPTINMARDPRWGRAEENYGEDVCLTSQIAVNFIRGMQGNHPKYLKTVATAKHFACNNVEKNRYGISSEVDERSLREYYLPAFKACVQDAGVYSIMSAYNAVNGVPSPANRTLLQYILRDEWGFDGYVVSDCDAVSNVWDPHNYVADGKLATTVSMINGNDLNCGTTFPENAAQAIADGLLTEADIDKVLKNLFKARFLLGEFDPAGAVPFSTIPANLLDGDANRELALRTAKEAIVLLKNKDGFLPINEGAVNKIAVIGPNANAAQLGGYSGTPSVSISVLQGIANRFGVDISNGQIEAEHFSGQSGIRSESCDEGGSNIGYIENGDYVVYSAVDFENGKEFIDVRVASENGDGKMTIRTDGLDGEIIAEFTVSATGGWQTWSTQTEALAAVTGVHDLYFKFTGTSRYLFNVNWFRVYSPNDVSPTDGDGKISYALGCSVSGAKDGSEFDKAVSLAGAADLVVLVCGTDMGVADEGQDRNNIDLPGVQNQLIQAVHAANPNTVLVLVNGASLTVNWAQQNIPAILTAWYDGQAQGEAISDVLFGDYNPAGRLSTTWFKSTQDLPSMSDYDVKNNRTYMYFEGEPLYPFGHGLSYTNFAYSDLTISSNTLGVGDSVTVSATIANSGSVAGDEVVQLYVHARSTLKRPIKELKAFKRIPLKAGERKTVSFSLKHADLEYYDEVSRNFMVESGVVDIYLGSSSADVRLQGELSTVGATTDSTYRNDPFTQFEAAYFEGKSKSASLGGVGGSRYAILTGNNSYIKFKNFDFTEPSNLFKARLAATNPDMHLDIVLDSPDGEVIGTLAIEPTATLTAFVEQLCQMLSQEGVRDICLVLRTATTASCNIDWIGFGDAPVGVFEYAGLSGQDGYTCELMPNPARSQFAVHYSLPAVSSVHAELFTLQGVRVLSLQNEHQPKGKYAWEFDVQAHKLQAGLYMLRFGAGAYQKIMPVTIIK